MKEGTIDKKKDSTDFVKLISAQKEPSNSFIVNYNRSKKVNKANYDSIDNAIRQDLFWPVRHGTGGIFDTLSSVIIIDGIKFNKYQIHVNVKERLNLVMWIMTTFYRNHLIVIAATYTIKEVGEEIEKMFLESKFEK